MRAANRYNIYPDNMASKIDVHGDITVKATSATNLAWVYGIEGQSTGIEPTTIDYKGTLAVDTMGAPSIGPAATGIVMGIKATPNLRYGVGDVVVNLKESTNINAPSKIIVKSQSSAQGIAAEALLGKDSNSSIHVKIESGAFVEVEGAANTTTAAVSLKRLPITLPRPLPSNPTPPSPQPASTITFDNQGNISSSNDLAVRGESTANTTTNVNNLTGGTFRGYVTMRDGADNISNAGTWTVQNCATPTCAATTIDLGPGTNSINNSGLMTIFKAGSSTSSNQASIKGGTLTVTNNSTGTIDMQDSDISGKLTVEGTFNTNGGTLKLDTRVVASGDPSDTLNIIGGITTGTTSTKITLKDSAGTTPATMIPSGGGITLVTYTTTSTPNAFIMDDFPKDGIIYRLRHDPAGHQWKLVTLRCIATNSPAYTEDQVTITCEGLEPGEKVNIPGTNCSPTVATSTQVVCSGKAGNIGKNPTVSVLDSVGNPRSSVPTKLATYTPSISVIENNKLANGTDKNKIEALLRDSDGNLVANTLVNITVGSGASLVTLTCTTDTQGKCYVEVANTIAGTYPIGTSVKGFPPSATPQTVTFVAGPAAAAQSQIAVTQDNQTADGIAYNTVTATAKDANGNPVAGETVSLIVKSATTGTILTTTSCVTKADGTCEIKITSTKAGAYNVSAFLGGNPLGAPFPISFKSAQPIPVFNKFGELFTILLMLLGAGQILRRAKTH